MEKTIEQVKRHNKAQGFHFFDNDTLQFFNSRLESQLIGDKYFVTSERMELFRPKLYTVRVYDWSTGKVGKLGRFQQHKTIDDALASIAQEVSRV